jgi:hypothetical protein
MPLMVSCNWSLFSSGRHCLPESISDLTDWGHSSTRLPSLQTPVASPGRQNGSTGCESGFPQPPLGEAHGAHSSSGRCIRLPVIKDSYLGRRCIEWGVGGGAELPSPFWLCDVNLQEPPWFSSQTQSCLSRFYRGFITEAWLSKSYPEPVQDPSMVNSLAYEKTPLWRCQGF